MSTPVRLAGGTTRAQVEVFLVQQRPRPVCAKCLASTLGLRNGAVQRATTMLEGSPKFILKTVACDLCGKLRLTVCVR